MVARPLFKIKHSMSDKERIVALELRLETERAKRLAAEKNARQFRALMLKAQVQALPKREKP